MPEIQPTQASHQRPSSQVPHQPEGRITRLYQIPQEIRSLYETGPCSLRSSCSSSKEEGSGQIIYVSLFLFFENDHDVCITSQSTQMKTLLLSLLTLFLPLLLIIMLLLRNTNAELKKRINHPCTPTYRPTSPPNASSKIVCKIAAENRLNHTAEA